MLNFPFDSLQSDAHYRALRGLPLRWLKRSSVIPRGLRRLFSGTVKRTIENRRTPTKDNRRAPESYWSNNLFHVGDITVIRSNVSRYGFRLPIGWNCFCPDLVNSSPRIANIWSSDRSYGRSVM